MANTPQIGETLRQARMRQRIDVSEIEAQTKIRAKYLRALENEEWDLLPGPTYVKSFLRTYANALGLDSKALLEDYRIGHERLSDNDLLPIAPPSRRNTGRQNSQAARQRQRSNRALLIGLGVLAVAAAIVLVAVIGGGGGGGANTQTTSTTTSLSHSSSVTTTTHTTSTRHHSSTAASQVVSLQLHPTGQVYVCLLAKGNRKLIATTLGPGSKQPTYRSRHFYMLLGNSSLTMRVNGKQRTVPPSSTPVVYSITSAGRHRLTAHTLAACA